VSLEPATALVTGTETATTHNGAPVPLPVILVRLYQNVFSEGVARNRQVELTGGMQVDRVAVNGVELEDLADDPDATQRDPGHRIIDTRMAVVPPEQIAAGSTTEVEIDWSFTVSGGGGFRNGHLDHEIYNIAQWYPQIAVFDDVFGLDTDAYLGDGEFYVDYGTFDVNIDVPAGWVVVGTGTLRNPDEVLRPEQVTVRNESDAVMPVELQITLADGTTSTIVWPVNVWAGTREVTRTLPVDGAVQKIVIDPDAWYPDVDRSNNSWERPAG